MFDNIFLPDPGPDGWSPAYLKIIRKAADQIIVNPALTYTEGQDIWQALTEDERGNMALRTPEAYLNEKVSRRRYGG